MDIKTIVQMESLNRGSITFHQQGNFYRAFNRSAQFFVENISEFKVQKKYIKMVKQYVAYVGFPVNRLDIIMSQANLKCQHTEGNPTMVQVQSAFIPKQPYESWFEQLPLPTEKELRDEALMQPAVKPAFKPNDALHIYKSAQDVLLAITTMIRNMQRDIRFQIGGSLQEKAYNMALIAYQYALGKRKTLIDTNGHNVISDAIDEIRIYMRLLVDMKMVSTGLFTEINLKLQYLIDQVTRK